MTLKYLDILIGFTMVMLGVSLLITVLIQIISALLGLRGTNLRWGIKTLLENASLKKEDANAIAESVLHHCLISDSTFSKFTPEWNWLKKSIARWKLATAIRKDELTGILNRIATPADSATPSDAAVALKGKLSQVTSHVDAWFDSIMDRVSQRFAMSTRMWTVMFAFMLAMGLHLDALALLRKLSADPVLRARLIANADAVARETSKVLAAGGETNAFVSAIEQLKKSDPEAAKRLTNAPAYFSPETVNLWLRTQLREHPQSQKVLAEYNLIVSSNIIARAPELMGSVATVHDELTAAGFELLPDFKTLTWRDYSPAQAGFWGMLASAALLSLGAPFWFNGLKTFMNLRPILANEVKKEEDRTKDPKPVGERNLDGFQPPPPRTLQRQ
jgi:hypothetical protein